MKEKIVFFIVVALVMLGVSAQGVLNQRVRRNQPMRPNIGNRQNAAPSANDRTAPTAQKEVGTKSIKFDNTDIGLVFQVYGELTGKTILVDPQAPKPQITLQPRADQVLSDEEKILALETVLEMNGIHLEPYGEKFMRALPRKEVRKEGVPLIMDPEAELGDTTRVISFMVQLKNIGVEDAQKTLDNFKSAAGNVIGFERTNSLLITDTEANVSRMREILRTIDIALPVLENVFVRQIKNAVAADIKTALEAIVQESQKDLTEQQKKGTVPGNQPHVTSPQRGLLRGQQQPAAPTANQSVVMGISDADRGMIRGKVLILSDERSNKLIIITQKSNMDFFDKVIEQLDIETTPDTVVKVYRLKYADAEDVSDMINDLIGNSSSSKNSKGTQNQNAKQGGGANISRGSTTVAKKPANQRTGESKAGELSKENTTVLSDKRINGLVVMTDKELVPTVEQIIESMDIKLSQVLIETCIIEVSLGDDLKTGIDWVQNGRYRENTLQNVKGEHGLDTYWYKKTETDDDGNTTSDYKAFEKGFEDSGYEIVDSENPIQEIAKVLTKGSEAGMFTGSPGYAQMLGGGANNGSVAADIVKGTATNVFSSAINYVFKSDKLNMSAIIQATKTDSRAKYIASPIVMTVDNKEATIEATQARKFLTNYQTSSSYYGSTPAPQYESKDIGIKIKVTPKINPNGTVMLEVEEEYSQVGAKQSILDPNSSPVLIDTALTRKMSADALLENMQTVILCGLTETKTSEDESGIPFLKDIPWIGKWLFSSVSQSESRSELVIFMTPYVLNDGEAAQVEAMRRKKVLSDSRPWDDHGWSLSPLADPVAKKEQMRRLKDEWKKQDEERQARIAIEQEKVKRAKQLKEMTKEERELWLKVHEEELKEEEREELEEKMLDPESQEELKNLAEKVRKDRLEKAEAELKNAAQETASQNERGRLEAEKAKDAKPESEEK